MENLDTKCIASDASDSNFSLSEGLLQPIVSSQKTWVFFPRIAGFRKWIQKSAVVQSTRLQSGFSESETSEYVSLEDERSEIERDLSFSDDSLDENPEALEV